MALLIILVYALLIIIMSSCDRSFKTLFIEEKKYSDVQLEKKETEILINDKSIESLIHTCLKITKNGRVEDDAYMKLVELGDTAVPALLKELGSIEHQTSHNITEGPASQSKSYYSYRLLGILSEIGTEKALPFIKKANALKKTYAWPSISLTHYREMITIWTSPDRLEQLLAALDKPYLQKWAIYKLGILCDKKALVPLQKILDGSDCMDLRESAKDSIRHIKSRGKVPLHYKYHRAGQTFKIKTDKQTYQLGESIILEYELIPCEYGSQTLLRFREAKAYLLPLGVAGPKGYADWRGRYKLHVRMMKPYSRPAKKIELDKKIVEEKAIEWFKLAVQEKISGKIDVSEAYMLNQAGVYHLIISINGYVSSNMIKIEIHPTKVQ